MKHLFFTIITVLALLPACKQKPYAHIIKPKEKTRKERIRDSKERYILLAKRKHKRPKDLSIQEAEEEIAFYADTEQYDNEIRILKHILTIETDQKKIGTYMLRLAKLQTSLGKLEEAQKTYHSFRSLYPGHQKIKKAMYREVLTHFWHILPPDRDQSRTEKTVKLAKNFIEEFPEDLLYKDSVENTIAVCHKNLFEGEIVRARHYITKNKYEPSEQTLMAAYQRLAYAQKEFLPKVVSSQETLAQLQMDFNNITEQNRDILEQLADDTHPKTTDHTGYLALAQKLESTSDTLLRIARNETPQLAANDARNRF